MDEFVSMEKVVKNVVVEGFLFVEIVVEFVYIVYGMSKDFGMNGFCVGCFYIKNKDLFEVRCFFWSFLYGMLNFL